MREGEEPERQAGGAEGRGTSVAGRGPDDRGGVRRAAAFGLDLARRWVAVLWHPRVRTFATQLAGARWAAVWVSVGLEAVIEAGGLAFVAFGPGAAQGVSSLPFGPKLHLPSAPGWLVLAAFAGSFAQFFLFVGLLFLSARILGGKGTYLAQAYLIALFWVPLMVFSAVAELFGTAGSVVGLVARVYALGLLGPALAAGQRLSLGRAWAAVGLVVLGGLLLGVVVLTVVLAVFGPALPELVN